MFGIVLGVALLAGCAWAVLVLVRELPKEVRGVKKDLKEERAAYRAHTSLPPVDARAPRIVRQEGTALVEVDGQRSTQDKRMTPQPTLSTDGYWLWTGTEWVPADSASAVAPPATANSTTADQATSSTMTKRRAVSDPSNPTVTPTVSEKTSSGSWDTWIGAAFVLGVLYLLVSHFFGGGNSSTTHAGNSAHKVTGNAAFKSLDRKVAAAYGSQQWFSHVKESEIDDSNKYISITTDYDYESVAGKTQSLAICNAYAKTAVTDVRVRVYDRRKHKTKTKTAVDGTKTTSTRKPEDYTRSESSIHVSFSGDTYLHQCEDYVPVFDLFDD